MFEQNTNFVINSKSSNNASLSKVVTGYTPHGWYLSQSRYSVEVAITTPAETSHCFGERCDRDAPRPVIALARIAQPEIVAFDMHIVSRPHRVLMGKLDAPPAVGFSNAIRSTALCILMLLGRILYTHLF